MVADTTKDLDYIKNPHGWVQWPLCPLKGRPPPGTYAYGLSETAYLFGREPVIRHGNIWTASRFDREERFASHEAIVAAGWRVD